MVERRLRRSRTNRMIAGVAGGLAEHFEVDSTLVRLVFVLLTLAGGAGIPIYIALAILMPEESSSAVRPVDVARENVADFRENLEEFRVRAEEFGEELRQPFREPEPTTVETRRARRDTTAGVILLVIGLIFLLSNLGFFWWFRWSQLWPLIIVAIGLALLLRRGRR